MARWRRSTTTRTPISPDPSGKKVAIIGYGSQGHAHALNLKDSGVDVRVGLAPVSKSGPRPRRRPRGGAGRRGRRWADVIMILVPDTSQKGVYDAEIGPNLRPGQTLMFAHGFNIRFGTIIPARGTWTCP